MMYSRIVTHDDMDGIVSAAVCSYYYHIEDIYFTGPYAIADCKVQVEPSDIVCDLPYVPNCGLWFDHHLGNKEALEYRGINIDSLPGSFELKDSCGRVIYDFLDKESIQWPEYLTRTLDEIDVIDSFAYSCKEDWLANTFGKLINNTLLLPFSANTNGIEYMRNLVYAIRDYPLEDIVEFDWVKVRIQEYAEREQEIIQTIQNCVRFLPEDKESALPIIDLTDLNYRPFIVRPMSFVLYPQSKAVVVVQNQFIHGVKQHNLNFSMSLGFYFYKKNHKKDLGSIMAELGIGDGHPGAAGGRALCTSKSDMFRTKEKLLKQIFRLWQSQPEK
ncbi:hypothetical protein KDK77_02280 [bacterium]|nr:hypothetical protein [bacterium]